MSVARQEGVGEPDTGGQEDVAHVTAVFVLDGLEADEMERAGQMDLYQPLKHGLPVAAVGRRGLTALDPLNANAPEESDLWRNFDPRNEGVRVNDSYLVHRTGEGGS